ncbi:hypothetical protein Sgou_34320 [Streptomyces gougerotii]|uniref:DUF485 domain-containing protein n=1 Tax=Streptomyces gougerotii TaxID=53448 RepID=A0A8H9HJH7_9ACTN|nr:hypothetical protein Sgou_34320 [Streptomyces gougerotii]GGU68071.1 hypothetical protein GCM10010227_22130 [Streptomyces gougerotii]
MDARPSTADVYREVRAGAAFQELRGRHRRFVVPACALFLTWYLAHVVAATTAPALVARPLLGPVNVALAAGFGQFASTFLLTWAYARQAGCGGTGSRSTCAGRPSSSPGRRGDERRPPVPGRRAVQPPRGAGSRRHRLGGAAQTGHH